MTLQEKRFCYSEFQKLEDKRRELIARQAEKPGFKGKINAKCIECMYDPSRSGDGNWRQQIAACTDSACPLYTVRPISKPETRKRKKRIEDKQ